MPAWKFRAPYNRGANVYTLTNGDRTLTLEADADGRFELEATPDFPIGIFAAQIKSKAKVLSAQPPELHRLSPVKKPG